MYGAALVFYEVLKPQHLKGDRLFPARRSCCSICSPVIWMRMRRGREVGDPCLRTTHVLPQVSLTLWRASRAHVCLVSQGVVPAVALAFLRGLQDLPEPALPHCRVALPTPVGGEDRIRNPCRQFAFGTHQVLCRFLCTQRYIANFFHDVPVPRLMQTVKYSIGAVSSASQTFRSLVLLFSLTPAVVCCSPGHAQLQFTRPSAMWFPLKDVRQSRPCSL